MASVFKTWDRRVERIVAIKVLRSLDKNDLKAVERFRREARAAAALAHPNAVTIYDFVEEAGQYFLVMEYIQGPTLKQLIGQRRQLQPRGETLTAPSDLYSLGVVMFEMLAGQPPFGGPTAVSIAMQHATATPPPLRKFNPNVPSAVEQVVARSLQKEPEDRFTSALEM